MPLGSISTVNTQLGNLQKGVENIGSPLALLEQRRQQRVAEAQKQKDLEIKEKEAKIKAQNAQTLAATEARTAGKESDVAKEMNRINKLYAPTAPSGTPEYLRQKYAYAQALQASANPYVLAHGNELLGKIEQDRLGTTPGGQSMGEQQDLASLQKTQAEAYQAGTQGQLNASLYNKPPTAPSKDLMAVAYERLKQSDAGASDWIPFNEKNEQELAIEAQRLAAYYQQVKTQYAARSGGQIMPEDAAWAAAEALLAQGGVGAESAGMPPQMAPQAPQMGMPPQPGGAPPMPQQQPQQPQGQPTVREITLSR